MFFDLSSFLQKCQPKILQVSALEVWVSFKKEASFIRLKSLSIGCERKKNLKKWQFDVYGFLGPEKVGDKAKRTSRRRRWSAIWGWRCVVTRCIYMKRGFLLDFHHKTWQFQPNHHKKNWFYPNFWKYLDKIRDKVWKKHFIQICDLLGSIFET